MTTATLIARKSTYITEQAARGNIRAAMWVQSEIDLLRAQEKEIARLRRELEKVVGRFLELNTIYNDTHELNQFILNHFTTQFQHHAQHSNSTSNNQPTSQKPTQAPRSPSRPRRVRHRSSGGFVGYHGANQRG